MIRESNSGLPFCVDVLMTVTPSVAVVPSPLVSSQNDPPVPLVYPDPGLFGGLHNLVSIIMLDILAIIPIFCSQAISHYYHDGFLLFLITCLCLQ